MYGLGFLRSFLIFTSSSDYAFKSLSKQYKVKE